MAREGPIGIFDSGVGGLSVVRPLRELAVQENLLYLADQAHVPYGARSEGEIQAYSAAIARFLLDQGAKIIVVACNTASAAALTYLRETFPGVSFVGMEPAVKPAARATRSGVVGVLATPGTFASPRYASLMARFAGGVTVLEDPCAGLVPLIESGALSAPQTAELLTRILRPMLAAGADTLVLGCTHYPFVRPLIERIVSREAPETEVHIVDPAPAVARQTLRVLAEQGLLAEPGRPGAIRLFSSGDGQLLAKLAGSLFGQALPVTAVRWAGGALCSA